MNRCLTCNNETENKKFCSRSCAATFNNKKVPKRKPEGVCFDCDRAVSSKRKYCDKCFQLRSCFQKDLSLKEAIYLKHHKSSAFALVRKRARAVLTRYGIKACQACGYSKHIEAAHRKPISSFAPEAMLSDINKPSNIAALCRNCHWEFDHGFLEVPLVGVEPTSFQLR